LSGDLDGAGSGIHLRAVHVGANWLQHENARVVLIGCVGAELIEGCWQGARFKVENYQRAEFRLKGLQQGKVFPGGQESVAGRDLQHRVGCRGIHRNLETQNDSRSNGLPQQREPARPVFLLTSERGITQRATRKQRQAPAPSRISLLQKFRLDPEKVFAGQRFLNWCDAHTSTSIVMD